MFPKTIPLKYSGDSNSPCLVVASEEELMITEDVCVQLKLEFSTFSILPLLPASLLPSSSNPFLLREKDTEVFFEEVPLHIFY